MQITLDIKKSIEQNASDYFEKAKKARKKIKGAEEAVERLKMRLAQEEKRLDKEAEKIRQKNEENEKSRRPAGLKKEWYENFRWFISSEGFLVVGGRDSTTNEIIIKKYMEKEDIVFHTDISGSPFFLVKAKKQGSDRKKPGEATIHEAADAACTYSRAWKLGLGSAEVFWVAPEQVSKTAESGEYMAKGAFMIRGKKNHVSAAINLAVGVMEDGKVMGGPLSAVKKNCVKYIELAQGNEKTSETAKKIRQKIGGNLDDVIKVIPAGGVKIKK